MSTTEDLLNDIKNNLSQTSTSRKDEIRVMQSMLNDMSYKVDIYSNDGTIESFCPAEEMRNTISSIIASTTKISNAEARSLISEHEFSKSEASTFIDVSKEFLNTYLQTGRKVGFGGRKDSNIFITSKEFPVTYNKIPIKSGEDKDGKPIYKSVKSDIPTPAHKGLTVSSSCPQWLLSKEN